GAAPGDLRLDQLHPRLAADHLLRARRPQGRGGARLPRRSDHAGAPGLGAARARRYDPLSRPRLRRPLARGREMSRLTGGLVDLQVNGFAGVDFNTPGLTPDGLDLALGAMLATGVTRCLPTLITAREANLIACLDALEDSVRRSALGPRMVLGYHLEGPFLSPEPGYRGCHPAGSMQAADLGLFDRLQEAAHGRIRLVTVAPEIPGALDL